MCLLASEDFNANDAEENMIQSAPWTPKKTDYIYIEILKVLKVILSKISIPFCIKQLTTAFKLKNNLLVIWPSYSHKMKSIMNHEMTLTF